jgi:hypothetical protein
MNDGTVQRQRFVYPRHLGIGGQKNTFTAQTMIL